MASDYGLNFGFRRSDESMRVSEGRVRTPVGSTLKLGTAVELDPADPDYVRVAAADAPPRTGICGLLLQEEFDFSIYESDIHDSFDLGTAKANRLSVITNGAGVKVWFQNTAQITRADGRVIPAVTLVNLTGVAVGSKLGWDGTQWILPNGTTVTVANAHMEVTALDAANGYVEAVLLK